LHEDVCEKNRNVVFVNALFGFFTEVSYMETSFIVQVAQILKILLHIPKDYISILYKEIDSCNGVMSKRLILKIAQEIIHTSLIFGFHFEPLKEQLIGLEL
jgi:hypothetical protein